jgi:predicted esterase
MPRSASSVAILLVGCVQASGASHDPERASGAPISGAVTPLAHAPHATEAASSPAGERRDTPESEHGDTREPAAGTLQLLAVSGFGTAVVAPPPAARRVPLLIATHGAGGDPRWECERWGRFARGRWFIACPRGVPLRRDEEGSYYYPDHPTLEREVAAVVAAARATYASLITTDEGVYLGYSQGATMGALMAVDHGAEFPHLVLIEGGSGDWTLKRAERFRNSGGKSVFIVCGTAACARRSATSAQTLTRAGLRAEARYAQGGGHTELGPVGREAEQLLETLPFSASEAR